MKIRVLKPGESPEDCRCVPGLERFFGHHFYLDTPAHGAVVAQLPCGLVVGMLRYRRRGSKWLRSVRALGTWVAPKFRGKGIALALWREMLRVEQPRTARVVTISKGGHGLIEALKRTPSDATIAEHCVI